jgi:TfoX/Sxy family transcriptional regulator of competence genes
MAYDRDLADRVREVLEDESAVREVKMFGGLSFMVNDKLTVNTTTRGDLLIRCDPDRVDNLISETSAEWAEMNGKEMSKGWLVIAAEKLVSDDDLEFWISVALDYNAKVVSKNGRGR